MRKMTKNEKYALAAFTLILALATAVYLNRPVTPDVAEIHTDPVFYGNVLQSPAVIFRLVYPFSDAKGAGQAAVFASDVLIFKHKAIILQIVEGNTCTEQVITPENATDTNKQLRTLSASACYSLSAKYPTIELREGPAKLSVTPSEAVISGNSHQIYVLTKYLFTRIWPDAEKVFVQTQQVLANVRQQ
ncbi:MAG: hypothetical protein GXN93_00655 [Candidatus Diapherotrites archaeon]|nr:hypothetical protein [Candidatus Diapherotrites archaeon]